ncbi:preprotein translocase, SecG subunit [Clostridium pasteurianum DSM 525 = ATCC 6013]|uniref:Protein-export membrane protein SecG n=1 Tax=Clostridium pasteurianum DSM 525 = ATCC 6013 TaxID=1262449 RepID=A0A0H3J6P1_CLOPA|nr:preprotein translocase subunit SecG [Clostridium pasteurianum]AJA48882.1 preprotein translocase, SecG subunit [Clostridium pasteurianum DSM 525 = ATCC 6013]AJA52870.1 preprotein translocase, SecG subunit [Clostridium pasteurianum DSM 525 = ATCC 6013]AOZ76092.1 preprotein translocase subunit SecG [Clostridium pasteurianum DSM 525 = ATCC 6013]AOZ79888.1 preprotein translocase subunit SecG [Clostridium pasteurianum]ELP60178.1 preprotein translocase subunit SecG [Clostridium pasteurianum DSM 52
MRNLLIVIQLISAVVIIVSILMQPSKMDGFANFVSGTTDTFFSRNKSKTRESMLARVTIVFSVIFALSVIAQNLSRFIQN